VAAKRFTPRLEKAIRTASVLHEHCLCDTLQPLALDSALAHAEDATARHLALN
jgi:hypothetical protein